MMAEVDLEQLWKDSAPGASQGGDVDLEKLWADSAPKQTSTWMDVVKSIPGGLAKGLVGFRGFDPESIADIGPSRPEAASAPTLKEAGNAENKINSVVDRYTYKPQTEAGRATQNVAGFVGDPMSYIGPGGPIRKGVQALGAGLGAELAGQVTKETPAEPYARAIGGMAVPAAANLLHAPIKMPPAEHMADVNLLRKEGINPTAGDVSGKKWVRRAEKWGDYLGGDDSYTRNQVSAAEGLTRRASKDMGSDVPRLTPEEFVDAEKRIGEKFDRAAKGITLNMSTVLRNSNKTLNETLIDIGNDMLSQGLPDEVEKRINQQLTNVSKAFDLGGKSSITGGGYQRLINYNSPLSEAMRADNADVKRYATKIRIALDDAAEAAAHARGTRPGVGRRKALQELKEARSEWFHFLTLRDIATKGGKAQEGLVTPGNLRTALTNTKDKKAAYALDRSKLAPISRAANNVMTPLKSTETSEIGMSQNAKNLFGLPWGLVGRAANSPAGQRYLMPRQRQYTGPIVSRAVAHALKDSDALSNNTDPLAQ